MRRLRVPALGGWAHDVCCTGDGEGLDAETVERSLGALGGSPSTRSARPLRAWAPRCLARRGVGSYRVIYQFTAAGWTVSSRPFATARPRTAAIRADGGLDRRGHPASAAAAG